MNHPFFQLKNIKNSYFPEKRKFYFAKTVKFANFTESFNNDMLKTQICILTEISEKTYDYKNLNTE